MESRSSSIKGGGGGGVAETCVRLGAPACQNTLLPMFGGGRDTGLTNPGLTGRTEDENPEMPGLFLKSSKDDRNP